MKLLQILGNATYIFYIVIILLALTFGTYYEFYNIQFDNFVDKSIVIEKVDRITGKSVTNYTVVDNEKNTYYFSRADFSVILDTFEVRQKWSTIKITYNTRNNEISLISDGRETEKSESVDWDKLIVIPIVFIAIGLFYLLKKAIVGEWFFKMYTRDIEENS
jgi:hypothetical protein